MRDVAAPQLEVTPEPDGDGVRIRIFEYPHGLDAGGRDLLVNLGLSDDAALSLAGALVSAVVAPKDGSDGQA